MRAVRFFLSIAFLGVPLIADEEKSLVEKLQSHVREARESLQRRHPELEPPLEHLERAASQVETSLDTLDRHLASSHRFLTEIGPCPDFPEDLPKAGAATPDVGEIAKELRQAPANVERAFDELREAREELHDALPKMPKEKAPPGFIEEANRALAATDELLARRRDALINARWLQKFEERRRRIANEAFPCEALQDIFPLPAPVSWRELRRDPLAPAKRLHERHERAIVRRHRALQEGDWGIGAGIIWTPVDAPRYGAVSDPNDPSRLVIARVSEETRAGQPVLMAHFRPPEGSFPFRHTIRPYLEFGAGLEFDEPSFFVGGALDLGPYLRLGLGWTAQQIEELVDGQEENAVIRSASDIRTESEFDGDVYVSFTIKLERMPWFGR